MSEAKAEGGVDTPGAGVDSEAKAECWAGWVPPEHLGSYPGLPLCIHETYPRGDGRGVPVTVVPTPRYEAMVEALRKTLAASDDRELSDAMYDVAAALVRVDAQEESDG